MHEIKDNSALVLVDLITEVPDEPSLGADELNTIKQYTNGMGTLPGGVLPQKRKSSSINSKGNEAAAAALAAQKPCTRKGTPRSRKNKRTDNAFHMRIS